MRKLGYWWFLLYLGRVTHNFYGFLIFIIKNNNDILTNKLDLTQKSMFKQHKFLPLGILANTDSNKDLSYLSVLS